MEVMNFQLVKRNYRFNKIESKRYFDNALLSGCGVYMDEFEKETDERISVVSSWSLIFKIVSLTLLAITIMLMLNKLILAAVSVFGISVILKVVNYILDKVAEYIQDSYIMTKMFLQDNCYSLLEDIRQDLIKQKEL